VRSGASRPRWLDDWLRRSAGTAGRGADGPDERTPALAETAATMRLDDAVALALSDEATRP